MRLKTEVVYAVAAFAAGLIVVSARVEAAKMTTERVASGLNRPVFVTAPPGDEDRLFIVEQRGVIKILDLTTGTVLPTAFLNIDPLVTGPTSTNDERGLLGMAFHPDFDSNALFYVYYTNPGTVVAQYSVSVDPNIADPASAVTVLTIAQPFSNHNGGGIGFGPNDGFLYIGTGDGGAGCDPLLNGQDINVLLGKMLRIDVNGDDFPVDPNRNYAIPPSNPFVGVAGADEIWAYGLRNPWRNSFDRGTGDMYIGDVGQIAWEEIDFLPASSGGGENYGWNCMEANACSAASSGCSPVSCVCNDPSLTDPIHDVSHSEAFSLTGGYAYRGCRIPGMQGEYFFADFVTDRIWSFNYSGAGTVPAGDVKLRSGQAGGTNELVNAFPILDIASFGEDAAGEIYIVDRGTTTSGEVFKIVPTSNNPADINSDGAINLDDVAILVDCLMGIDPGDPALVCRCDVNDDGLHNGLDIQAFVDEI